jgi:hypothetical protein
LMNDAHRAQAIRSHVAGLRASFLNVAHSNHNSPNSDRLHQPSVSQWLTPAGTLAPRSLNSLKSQIFFGNYTPCARYCLAGDLSHGGEKTARFEEVDSGAMQHRVTGLARILLRGDSTTAMI